jgi:hypothetical protein
MENYPSDYVEQIVNDEINGILEWDDSYSKVDFFVESLLDAQRLDREDGHIEQDKILLQIIRSYIGNDSDFSRIEKAYNSFGKWYA